MNQKENHPDPEKPLLVIILARRQMSLVLKVRKRIRNLSQIRKLYEGLETQYVFN